MKVSVGTMRVQVAAAYMMAFLCAAAVVIGVGLVAAHSVQQSAYQDQLLRASVKAAQWATTIEAQFATVKGASQTAATSLALLVDTFPVQNGTKEQRMVRVDDDKYSDMAAMIFADHPNLLYINTFADFIFSQSYPYNENIQKNGIGVDIKHAPPHAYMHELKRDGIPRAKYLSSAKDLGGAIIGIMSRVMATDPLNPRGPKRFFGFISAVVRLTYLTDVIFDFDVPTAQGYVAEVDVYDQNVTQVLATSSPGTTPLWQDAHSEAVVQTINIDFDGVFQLRVRPIDGWHGAVRSQDVAVTVMVALATGLAAVYGAHSFRLWRRRKAARQADAVRGEAHLEFAGYIYHEIRNPTHALLAALELAPRAIKDLPDYRLMRSATTMIHRLLDSALDLLKLESGKTVLEAAPVALIELVEECVTMSRARLPKPHMTMTWTAGDSVPGYVVGDPLRLQQILMNLLSNAAKYCRNSVEVHVDVGHESMNELDEIALVVSVRDDGHGIAPDAKKRLFSRFVQAKASTSREHGGTGLGLCISKGFVELMGGTIECDSVVGESTTFTVRVTLPLSDAPVVAATLTDSMSSNDSIGNITLRSLRVLVVDDTAINRHIGSRAVSLWTGSDCSLAVDGRDAVDQYTAALHEGVPFDVVFMDLTMPVMDGWAATEAIRALEASHDAVPAWIVALSGSCIRSDVERAHRSGVDEFLSKPSTIHMFRQALMNAVASDESINEQGLGNALNRNPFIGQGGKKPTA